MKWRGTAYAGWLCGWTGGFLADVSGGGLLGACGWALASGAAAAFVVRRWGKFEKGA